jgi:hypothetical protein
MMPTSVSKTVTFILALALAAPVAAQTAIELKKELFPKYKKAQAEHQDLGDAGKLYAEGDEALKQGLQEEALEFFQQAKDAWPSE